MWHNELKLTTPEQERAYIDATVKSCPCCGYITFCKYMHDVDRTIRNMVVEFPHIKGTFSCTYRLGIEEVAHDYIQDDIGAAIENTNNMEDGDGMDM